jgi:hypothetical protein
MSFINIIYNPFADCSNYCYDVQFLCDLLKQQNQSSVVVNTENHLLEVLGTENEQVHPYLKNFWCIDFAVPNKLWKPLESIYRAYGTLSFYGLVLDPKSLQSEASKVPKSVNLWVQMPNYISGTIPQGLSREPVHSVLWSTVFGYHAFGPNRLNPSRRTTGHILELSSNTPLGAYWKETIRKYEYVTIKDNQWETSLMTYSRATMAAMASGVPIIPNANYANMNYKEKIKIVQYQYDKLLEVCA